MVYRENFLVNVVKVAALAATTNGRGCGGGWKGEKNVGIFKFYRRFWKICRFYDVLSECSEGLMLKIRGCKFVLYGRETTKQIANPLKMGDEHSLIHHLCKVSHGFAEKCRFKAKNGEQVNVSECCIRNLSKKFALLAFGGGNWVNVAVNVGVLSEGNIHQRWGNVHRGYQR